MKYIWKKPTVTRISSSALVCHFPKARCGQETCQVAITDIVVATTKVTKVGRKRNAPYTLQLIDRSNSTDEKPIAEFDLERDASAAKNAFDTALAHGSSRTLRKGRCLAIVAVTLVLITIIEMSYFTSFGLSAASAIRAQEAAAQSANQQQMIQERNVGNHTQQAPPSRGFEAFGLGER